jgi:hypothetical protein
MLECYLNLPELPHPERDRLNYAHIREQQQQDGKLLTLQTKYPDNYVNLQLDPDVDDIICYEKDLTQDNWKIALPDSMVENTVKWFHQVMGHPGEKRLTESLRQRYHNPALRRHIEQLKWSEIQNIRLWLRTATRKRSTNSTLGRSLYRSHWTLGSQGQWPKSRNQCTNMH